MGINEILAVRLSARMIKKLKKIEKNWKKFVKKRGKVIAESPLVLFRKLEEAKKWKIMSNKHSSNNNINKEGADAITKWKTKCISVKMIPHILQPSH